MGGRSKLPMVKEVKIIKKVKRLLKRLHCPRWLHRFGPKTYEFYHHLVALLVRHYCKNMSYRRVVKLLSLFDIICPSKSALQYTAKKIPSALWQKVLAVTAGSTHHIVAIDSTGLSRTNPSYHYLKRIDGKIPKIPVKMSCSLDTQTKKFCAAKVRVLPAHDIKDAKFLLSASTPNIGVLDKAYPSEKLYKYAHQEGILLMIPQKKNARRGKYRKKMHKQFRRRTYNRRSLVEAGFGAFKRKYGSSVSSKRVKTIRADVHGRLACHNFLGRKFKI